MPAAAAATSVTPARTFRTDGIKPAPRERVQPRSQFDSRALSGAASNGNLPEEGSVLSPNGRIVIAIAARPDTDKHLTRRGKLQKCAVNANADALIREHGAGRLSVEEYGAGFILQFLLERAHGMTAPSNREFLAPSSGNNVRGQANAVMKMMERAEFSEQQFRIVNALVGMTGMRILTLCLLGTGDGSGPKTFSEVAEIMGLAREWKPEPDNDNSRSGPAANDNDRAYGKRLKNEGMKIGWAFRTALGVLASKWELGSAPKLATWGR
jgi:hypothetical protein